MSSNRLKTVALAAALAITAAGSSVALAASPDRALAQGTPDKVIDASADPDGAADALNTGACVPKPPDGSNCWTSAPMTLDYGPPSILGDVLYNCSPDSYAETAVGITDQRQETTSISEKVSLKISLKVIGLAKSSAEFSAFSKQTESFSTSVTVTNTVAVPPGYKGWTVTRVLTGYVTGSAYVTSGINKLIQVSNIDLTFPGFRDPGDTSDDSVLRTGIKAPMTAADITAACDNDQVKSARQLAAARARATFKLNLCGRSASGSVRCRARKVVGSLPPRLGRATASLTRDGRTWAAGSVANGRVRLTARRPAKAGKYTLTLRERPAPSQRTGSGPLKAIKTLVPVVLR